MREAKPFWKASHQCWYVKIKGVQTRLDPDEKIAHKMWHQLQGRTRATGADTLLLELISEFLAMDKRKSATSTHEWYKSHLKSFHEHVGRIKAMDLKPIDVERWLAKRYPDTNNGSTLHQAMRPIVRVMNWAAGAGLIAHNPLKSMKKPRPTTRDVDLTPEQYEVLLAAIEGDTLRDIVEVMWNTGCRPQEARVVEAKNVGDRCWSWPKSAPGKFSGRTVLLNERAWEITQRLQAQYPTGPLFRNRLGNGWTKDAFAKRLRQLSAEVGVRVVPYSLRVGFATNSVVRGTDVLSLATLMGHTDLRMLNKVYAKVHKRSDHLRNILDQVTKQPPAA